MIFTTTRQPDSDLFGTDNGPLYSRCHCIRLTNQGAAARSTFPTLTCWPLVHLVTYIDTFSELGDEVH